MIIKRRLLVIIFFIVLFIGLSILYFLPNNEKIEIINTYNESQIISNVSLNKSLDKNDNRIIIPAPKRIAEEYNISYQIKEVKID